MNEDRLEKATDRAIRSWAMKLANSKNTFRKVCAAVAMSVMVLLIIVGMFALVNAQEIVDSLKSESTPEMYDGH